MLTILFFGFNSLVLSHIFGLSIIPLTFLEFYAFKIIYSQIHQLYQISAIYMALLNMIVSCYFIGYKLASIITLEIIIANYFKYLLIVLRENEIKYGSYGNSSRYFIGDFSNCDLRHIYQFILEIICELEGL